MKYLRVINNEIVYPYSLDKLRENNPNTSFPDNITKEILIEYGVYDVLMVELPLDHTKNYIESTPILIDNQYYQNWIVTDATNEQITERVNGQWDVIRNARNTYLSECDWTQLPDSPLTAEKKTEWTAYRQSLRDITLQQDPFNIVWPTKPL